MDKARNNSATVIQTTYRGWKSRWTTNKELLTALEKKLSDVEKIQSIFKLKGSRFVIPMDVIVGLLSMVTYLGSKGTTALLSRVTALVLSNLPEIATVFTNAGVEAKCVRLWFLYLRLEKLSVALDEKEELLRHFLEMRCVPPLPWLCGYRLTTAIAICREALTSSSLSVSLSVTASVLWTHLMDALLLLTTAAETSPFVDQALDQLWSEVWCSAPCVQRMQRMEAAPHPLVAWLYSASHAHLTLAVVVRRHRIHVPGTVPTPAQWRQLYAGLNHLVLLLPHTHSRHLFLTERCPLLWLCFDWLLHHNEPWSRELSLLPLLVNVETAGDGHAPLTADVEQMRRDCSQTLLNQILHRSSDHGRVLDSSPSLFLDTFLNILRLTRSSEAAVASSHTIVLTILLEEDLVPRMIDAAVRAWTGDPVPLTWSSPAVTTAAMLSCVSRVVEWLPSHVDADDAILGLVSRAAKRRVHLLNRWAFSSPARYVCGEIMWAMV